MEQLMACNEGWLDGATSKPQVEVTKMGGLVDYSVGNITTTLTTTNGSTGDWWGSYYYPVYYTSPARPIKLTMTEVERLRKAAKSDDKLRAILLKFTSQIEVSVDF
jgi:hypothetical protein